MCAHGRKSEVIIVCAEPGVERWLCENFSGSSGFSVRI